MAGLSGTSEGVIPDGGAAPANREGGEDAARAHLAAAFASERRRLRTLAGVICRERFATGHLIERIPDEGLRQRLAGELEQALVRLADEGADETRAGRLHALGAALVASGVPVLDLLACYGRHCDELLTLAGAHPDTPPSNLPVLAQALFRCVLLDIGMAMHGYQAQMEHLAFYDALTDLPNRCLFLDRLRRALAAAKRHGGAVAVLFVDLDLFKSVNDRLGHAAGDRLLQATARRLRDGVRSSDTVARFGGDEFVVLLTDVDEAGAAALAAKLSGALAEPFEAEGQALCLTASIGVAIAPGDGDDAEVLLCRADEAMYRAKARGRNTITFYGADMMERATPTPPESPVRTLLLVDDEEYVLSSLLRLLRKEGYRIHKTTSALAALELLGREPVGVIVSDYAMPEMTGTEFLRRAKHLRPDSVCLMLSGSIENRNMADVLADGTVYKLMHKPWHEDLLRADLRDAFDLHERPRHIAAT